VSANIYYTRNTPNPAVYNFYLSPVPGVGWNFYTYTSSAVTVTSVSSVGTNLVPGNNNITVIDNLGTRQYCLTVPAWPTMTPTPVPTATPTPIPSPTPTPTPVSWWQVGGAGILSAGNISSALPVGKNLVIGNVGVVASKNSIITAGGGLSTNNWKLQGTNSIADTFLSKFNFDTVRSRVRTYTKAKDTTNKVSGTLANCFWGQAGILTESGVQGSCVAVPTATPTPISTPAPTPIPTPTPTLVAYTFPTGATMLGTATTYDNQNITVPSGAVVIMSGNHTFGSVNVQAGGTINVSVFDNSAGSGTLVINGSDIAIAGTVDGTGQGYGGGGGGGANTYENDGGSGGSAIAGGGGGGGGSATSGYMGYCPAGSVGGSTSGGGTNGGNGQSGCGPSGSRIGGNGGNGISNTLGGVAVYSGGGGAGGGTYGGAGGAGTSSTTVFDGNNGGYMASNNNGDTSVDGSIVIGSGGGGGGGSTGNQLRSNGASPATGASGGGAGGGVGGTGGGAAVSVFASVGSGGGGGGAGGASIKLIASNSITVSGTLKSNGSSGGAGGNNGYGAGGNGGNGAGGGILVSAPVVNLTGATVQSTNYGTIKVFYGSYSGNTLNTTNFPSGRLYSSPAVLGTSTSNSKFDIGSIGIYLFNFVKNFLKI
jgi:hypothetical protein